MLGRPLVDLLLAEGARVRVLDIVRPKEYPVPTLNLDFRHCDMEDRDAIIGLLEGCEYVFHLAGAKGGTGIGRTRAADFLRANLQPTLYLFKEICKSVSKIKRLLFVSSVGAYSGGESVFREDRAWEGQPHQSDFYGGFSKRFGELMCKAYREQFGLDYVVVRPTNCFGPHDRFDAETGMVIPALIRRLEDGERPLIFRGSPTAMRDFLYSKECARGMVLAMKRGRAGEIYNLGTGKPVNVLAVAEHLAFMYDTKVILEPSQDRSPSMRCMDMTKSGAELGFVPDCRLFDYLQETIDWYRANKGKEKYDPFKS